MVDLNSPNLHRVLFFQSLSRRFAGGSCCHLSRVLARCLAARIHGGLTLPAHNDLLLGKLSSGGFILLVVLDR